MSMLRATGGNNPPYPNLALEQFVWSSNTGGSSGDTFDGASWNSTAAGNALWNSASWNSALWNSASWDSSSRGDAAEDNTAPSPVTLSASQVATLIAGLAP